MPELLQEFVDSGSQRLRVDRSAGVIRGVKLLGLASRNGRRYRETALVDAVALYEGAKVNINHPKGHPLSPRDYQDRLGAVRGVHFRAGDGLFGDLHFNPKHALSEQLVWDAEHAPQNLGMSHNVLARTTRSGGEIIVESITKVQSIDLVADPATTSGLYESQELTVERLEPETKASSPDLDSRLSTLDLNALRAARPDLICEIENAYEARVADLQAQLDELIVREQASQRRRRIEQLLEEHGLPLPTSDNDAEPGLVSGQFLATLMHAADDQSVVRLIEDRAALVRSACRWDQQHGRLHDQRLPRSRDQLAVTSLLHTKPIHSASEFAMAICGR